ANYCGSRYSCGTALDFSLFKHRSGFTSFAVYALPSGALSTLTETIRLWASIAVGVGLSIALATHDPIVGCRRKFRYTTSTLHGHFSKPRFHDQRPQYHPLPANPPGLAPYLDRPRF